LQLTYEWAQGLFGEEQGLLGRKVVLETGIDRAGELLLCG